MNRELPERLAGPPTIEAKVIAPGPIACMDVVRDGRFLSTTHPGTAAAAFRFVDRDLAAGQNAYYYVRAQIGASDFAWSSPIWVTRSP